MKNYIDLVMNYMNVKSFRFSHKYIIEKSFRTSHEIYN
ncbi:MAG: hypothetical protein K0S41_2566 [Anaerocolumna sp.]|jgi:hypothetical protein|nr:hypothetical protein [Anaerocolumna sp.]